MPGGLLSDLQFFFFHFEDEAGSKLSYHKDYKQVHFSLLRVYPAGQLGIE